MIILLLACSDPSTDTVPEATEDTAVPVELCEDGLPKRTFDPAAAGTAFGEAAPDFTVHTTTGDWTLSEHFDGCRSYVFLGVEEGSLLFDSKAKKLFSASPLDTEYFFYADAAGSKRETVLADIQAAIDAGLATDDGAAFVDHVHYVDMTKDELGVIADLARVAEGGGASIDRFGRWREVGSLADPATSWSTMEWSFLGAEAWLFSFEATREATLESRDATVVRIYDNVLVEDPGWAGATVLSVVDMPDLTGFDRVDVDVTNDCTGNTFADCPAWDYINLVYVCDADDPGTDEDESYENCEELARIITPYWSHGRWVVDGSHLLERLHDSVTFRAYSQQPYYFTVDLRFWTSEDKGTPLGHEALWTGGSWTETYNDEHPPITFTPPAGTTRVKLYTLITGHGFSYTYENCAEFCNTESNFSVNGGASYLVEHPEASTNDGCVEQVGTKGTLPNQAGTWVFGRNGWCPGLAVDPISFDVTADVDLTGENTISYTTLFEGENYVPNYRDENQQVAPNLDVTTWLVYESD